MKIWLTLLLLLLIACVAAFGWQMLAADPGYVLIRIGDTSIETSAIFASLILLLLWGALSLVWWLLSWPRAAWARRNRRRGRERIAGGLVALAEGRYAHALRELERASHQSELHAPALLAAARAANARGDAERAHSLLGKASAGAGAAALALRARFLLEQGKAQAALDILKPAAQPGGSGKTALAPAGWRLLAEAASACGDNATAVAALAPLARSQTLTPVAFSALESRVLSAALLAAKDGDTLNTLWSGLNRPQRRVAELVASYARRAAALGQMLAAMSEIEAALRRDWSELLIRSYGDLGPAESETRLRHAEEWLSTQAESPGLMLTLGTLCVQSKLWGKAREYLQLGLALESSPDLWESFGDCAAGQLQIDEAAAYYRNALKTSRGEVADMQPGTQVAVSTRASVLEERSEHGVPRLPARSGAA